MSETRTFAQHARQLRVAAAGHESIADTHTAISTVPLVAEVLRDAAADLDAAEREIAGLRAELARERERVEALEAQMRAEFPTSLIRATICGSFGLANGVLEEQDYDGNWHEVAWSEDDRRPMEALAELLATYEPIGATPAPQTPSEDDCCLWPGTNRCCREQTPSEGGTE